MLRALRSPLALDIYCWLTYRASYLRRPTEIPWTALALQFGAGYADPNGEPREARAEKAEPPERSLQIRQASIAAGEAQTSRTIPSVAYRLRFTAPPTALGCIRRTTPPYRSPNTKGPQIMSWMEQP